MLNQGYLTVARLFGTSFRLHWTLPLGALFFSGFRFAPVFWVAFFGLVFVHELGHAALVKIFGHRVVAVDITGFGGMCRWSGTATPEERGAIAWGGVLAQGVVLAIAFPASLVLGRPTTLWQAELVHVLITTNLYLAALNLLPIPPLDGAEAWRFVLDLIRRPRWPFGRGGGTHGGGWQPPPGNGGQGGGPAWRPPPGHGGGGWRAPGGGWTAPGDGRGGSGGSGAPLPDWLKPQGQKPPPGAPQPPRDADAEELARKLAEVAERAGRARRGD